jgi:hypothetical protein
MAELKNPEFWRLCLLVQVREIEEALEAGDLDHAIEEIVDTVTVGLNALQALGEGKTVVQIIGARLTKNEKKDVYARDIEYYKHKLKLLEEKLGLPTKTKEECYEECNDRLIDLAELREEM